MSIFRQAAFPSSLRCVLRLRFSDYNYLVKVWTLWELVRHTASERPVRVLTASRTTSLEGTSWTTVGQGRKIDNF